MCLCSWCMFCKDSVWNMTSTVNDTRLAGIEISTFSTALEDVVDVENFHNARILNHILKCYTATLILEYICVFAFLPFDDIDNRPIFNLVFAGVCLFMFCVCACCVPLIINKVPSYPTCRAALVSTIAQTITLATAIVSTVECTKVDEMYSNEYDDILKQSIKVNVTNYIHIVSVMSLIVCFVSTITIYAVTGVCVVSLSNLLNLIDRKSVKNQNKLISIPTELPREMVLEQMRLYYS